MRRMANPRKPPSALGPGERVVYQFVKEGRIPLTERPIYEPMISNLIDHGLIAPDAHTARFRDVAALVSEPPRPEPMANIVFRFPDALSQALRAAARPMGKGGTSKLARRFIQEGLERMAASQNGGEPPPDRPGASSRRRAK